MSLDSVGRRILSCAVTAMVLVTVPGALKASDEDKREARILNTLKAMEESADKTLTNISPDDGRLLVTLAHAADAQHVLEISRPAGYSTLWLCLALKDTGGRVTLLMEKKEEAETAREHLAKAGVEEMVEVIVGNPHDTMGGVRPPLDFVFLDADKGGNNHYLHNLLPKIRPGGFLIADDIKRDHELVDDYLDAIAIIPKLTNAYLNMHDRGMSVSVVKHRDASLDDARNAGTSPSEAVPGPRPRGVERIPPGAILGYINHVPPETPAHRKWRHRKVAERRKGTPIMVHRGDDGAAPENTLEAYMAAIDHGTACFTSCTTAALIARPIAKARDVN